MTSTADVQALRDALFQVLFRHTAEDEAAACLAIGLRAEHALEIQRLADHAERVDSAINRRPGGKPRLNLTVRRMMWDAARAVIEHEHVDVAVVMCWLAVLAAETENAPAGAPHARLRAFTRYDPSPGLDYPLAYAAGLSADEAHAGHLAGTLDPLTLRTLAALRGYRFPAGF